MKRHTVHAVSLAAAIALAPAAAGAADLALKADPSAREAAIVTTVYEDFLAKNRTVKLETAVVDLDNDKVGEIVVRFNDKSTCGDRGCYTVVLRYGQNGWEPVFERTLKTLGTRASTLRTVRAAELVVDGKEAWALENGHTYRPLLASLGAVLFPTAEPSKAQAEAVQRVLDVQHRDGVAFSRTMGTDIAIRVAEVDLDGAGGKDFIAIAESPALCGASGVCPNLAFLATDKGYKPVLDTPGTGATVLPGAVTGGLKDIVFADDAGFRVARWGGTGYRIAETSYASPFTQTP